MGAHYSKNWTKDKQKSYNHEYYEKHKDKWATESSSSERKVDPVNNEYEKKVNKKVKDTTNQAEKSIDDYLNSHDDPISKFLYTARNETIQDTINRVADALSKKKKKDDTLADLEHADFMDIPIDEDSLDLANDVLMHHQRLGAKWNVHNGPPYPLQADQLSAEQKKQGGVSPSAKAVANGTYDPPSEGGKGVGDSPKKSLMERYQEKKAAKKKAQHDAEVKAKRQAAAEKARATKAANAEAKKKAEEEEAAAKKKAEDDEKQRQEDLNSGDYKRISKWIDQSTYNELNSAILKADAAAKIRQKADPAANQAIQQVFNNQNNGGQQPRHSEAVEAALNSGDYKKIQEVATDPSVSSNDLQNAMNKARYVGDLKAQTAGPTVTDRINQAMNMIGTANNWVNTAVNTQNTLAKLYNSANAKNTKVDDIPLWGQVNTNILTAAQKKANEAMGEQRKAVQRAFDSHDPKKIADVMPLMNSNELQNAYNYFNNQDSVKKQLNRAMNEKQDKERADAFDAMVKKNDFSDMFKNAGKYSTDQMQAAIDRQQKQEQIRKNAEYSQIVAKRRSGESLTQIAEDMNMEESEVSQILYGQNAKKKK